MAPRAAVYCRISRDKVGAGLGVERQRADCVELAKRLGATVVDFYEDNDLSAYSGKPRPDYRRMLADVTAAKINVILAWHTDRLHRSPVELEEFIELAECHGVITHTVKAGEVDLSTPSGRAVARTLGAWARYESEHRSERVVSKRNEIAREGGFLGGSRPFGFENDGVTLRDNEAKAIRDATKALLEDRSTLYAEAAKLNEAGFRRARSGEPWTPRALGRVLARPRNAGLMVHRGNVVGKASWEPIVGEYDWRGVCDLLQDPARRKASSNKIKWLGSGLYRCGTCGQGMRVNTTSRSRSPDYRCPGTGDGRRHVTRGAVALDAWVARLVVTRLSQPLVQEALARMTAAPEIDYAALHRELDDLTATRDELARQQAEGEITIGQFTTMNTSAREREEAIKQQLAASRISHPAEKLVNSGNVKASWDALSLDERRSVLAATVEITVKRGKPGRRHPGDDVDQSAIGTEFLI